VELSSFGRRLTRDAGISRLMEDFRETRGENGAGMCMLGGGNPGHIPAVSAVFRERMRRMLERPGAFEDLIGNYDPPAGQPRFAAALARLLRGELGWDVGPEHIAVTNGSQSASFMLFNLLAGRFDDGSDRHVLLPLTPEYIGYADQGLAAGLFRAPRPRIVELDELTFKYHVDFEALTIDEHTAALCVSRPTNPTGNLLTDPEMARLGALTRERGIPLIVDNAYGVPFPGICFAPATPYFDEHVVVLMSLSKLGLPGVRTGIVVARPELVRAVAAVNAVLNLTTGGFGQALALELIESGEIIALGRDRVRPFYQAKAERAVECLRRELDGYPLRVHRPEGAIFLWLWFPELPIRSAELYARAKARGVLVCSGHYFFPGLEGAWRHREECLRVTYAQDDEVVERGLRILAAEVRRAYDEAG